MALSNRQRLMPLSERFTPFHDANPEDKTPAPSSRKKGIQAANANIAARRKAKKRASRPARAKRPASPAPAAVETPPAETPATV